MCVRASVALLPVCLLVWVHCGDSTTPARLDGGGGGGFVTDAAVMEGPGIDSGATVDAGSGAVDAGGGGGGATCVPGSTECTNCLDDDGDGLVDGQDPHCAGSLDDDEASFATGINGDNIDSKWQDCFFDGNSGGGDDKCRYHTCCLLGATSGATCPVDQNFNPNTDCPAQTDQCIEFCAPLAPVGCDCFGCCTICDPQTDECFDVLTNPAVAPDCTLDGLGDPDKCPTCIKNTACNGGQCDAEQCILCPGQTEEDLPDSCSGQNQCPGTQTACETTADCGAGRYCSVGCCVKTVD